MIRVQLRKIWEEEQVPQTDWKEGYLIRIAKKGDMNKRGNYRGITLLSVPGNNFQQSVAEPDERLNRRLTPRLTGRIP
ncbi:unnamed protein product [Schistosoma mattheei]|uniref:Uncharacterized protein n=1 Tax=Schistosoma mattheei TaxID=31246 RepID=A0A183P9J4_9TREM|nr:unnamed protein product [Schistosoma mattheei]